MNRGSNRLTISSPCDAMPFNEAPIHESGKLRTSTTGSATRSAFNEAPIHESGKYEAQEEIDRLELPSMRPRFMNRGSRVPELRHAYARDLQ